MPTVTQTELAAASAHIPLRTVEDVADTLKEALKQGSDRSFARMMLNHGRLTDEACEFVRNWLA